MKNPYFRFWNAYRKAVKKYKMYCRGERIRFGDKCSCPLIIAYYADGGRKHLHNGDYDIAAEYFGLPKDYSMNLVYAADNEIGADMDSTTVHLRNSLLKMVSLIASK